MAEGKMEAKLKPLGVANRPRLGKAKQCDDLKYYHGVRSRRKEVIKDVA